MNDELCSSQFQSLKMFFLDWQYFYLEDRDLSVIKGKPNLHFRTFRSFNKITQIATLSN